MCRIPGHGTQGQGGFVRNLGWGLSALAQVCLTKICRGLGYFVPVFCTGLDLFHSIYFPIFQFFCMLGWETCISGLTNCPLPLFIVIRRRLLIRQSCLAGAAGWKLYLAFMPHIWWNWHIKLMQSISMRNFKYMSQVNGEFFHTWK